MNARVIYFNGVLNREKFVLQKEYKGFGIYEEMTPTGWYIHQSWALSNGEVRLIIESYNNICEAELLDLVDHYTESGRFGVKAMSRGYKDYLMHPNGAVQC